MEMMVRSIFRLTDVKLRGDQVDFHIISILPGLNRSICEVEMSDTLSFVFDPGAFQSAILFVIEYTISFFDVIEIIQH